MLLKYSILCLLLTATLTQEATDRNKANEVVTRENELRSQNQMSYTNIKAYTFLCGRFEDFIIKPSLSKLIKFEIHVYWKQQNVYVSAEYREGEEIRVIVYEDNQRVLLDREFYITTGFSFQANHGSVYTVRFLAAGRVNKLVSMMNSSPIQVSEDVATKQHMEGAQLKVESIGNELKALFTISQRNFIMQQQVRKKILTNTNVYLGYEIFEVLLIIAVTAIQIISITKLLKGGSIV